MWKVEGDRCVRIGETSLKQEKFLEEHLEDWIITTPEILGEPLFVIGRQVLIPDVKDKIDILALDVEGNTVIVELKRGRLKDPAEIQALRYASYVAKWSFTDIERQANGYRKQKDPAFDFNQAWEEYCAERGVEAVEELNREQRIILVGSGVRDKVGSVALWLRQHNIDITVIDLAFYREGSSLILQAQVIIPPPVSPGATTGTLREQREPWLQDGRAWHLDRWCSPKTREMLLQLEDLVEDNFPVEGHWNQKYYVRFDVGDYPWLVIHARPNQLLLEMRVKAGSFRQSELAGRLGLKEFVEDLSLAEKLGLPSSVQIKSITPTEDRVELRLKPEFTVGSDDFLAFLRDAFKAWPKHGLRD